jgi:SAM-dependent methyltransferase
MIACAPTQLAVRVSSGAPFMPPPLQVSHPGLRDLYATADLSDALLLQRNDDLAEQVLGLLDLRKGARVLDLGCGSATLAVELAERGYDVTGLDLFIANAHRRARLRNVTLTLIEQDMATLEASESFDAVINWDISGVGTFPMDEENLDVVRRVSRALVPNGQFLLQTYHLPWIARRGGVEGLGFDPSSRRCFGSVTRKLADGHQKTWPLSFRAFSVEEWRVMLGGAGLEITGMWSDFSRAALNDDSRMLVIRAQKHAQR